MATGQDRRCLTKRIRSGKALDFPAAVGTKLPASDPPDQRVRHVYKLGRRRRHTPVLVNFSLAENNESIRTGEASHYSNTVSSLSPSLARMHRQPVALLFTLGLVLLLVDTTCSTFYRSSHSISHRQKSGGHYHYKVRPVYGKWLVHKTSTSGVPVVSPGGAPGHTPSMGVVPPGTGGSNDPGFSLVDNVDVRAKSFGGTCPPGCRPSS
nr:uncharacterized protein LOC123761663 [Procambarus clarkii]